MNSHTIFINREDCRIERKGGEVKIIYIGIIFEVSFLEAHTILHKYFEFYRVKDEYKLLIIEKDMEENI